MSIIYARAPDLFDTSVNEI